MLLQLQNKNKVVSPSKRTRKHKGSGDKASRKADREYMANNVNPVMLRVMKNLIINKPEDMEQYLKDELQTVVQEMSNGTFNSSPPKSSRRVKLEEARAMAAQTGTSGSSARSKIAGAQQMAAQIEETGVEAVVGEIAITSSAHVVTEVVAPPKKMDFVLIVIGVDGAGKTTLLNSLQGKGHCKTVPSCGFSSVSMQLEENTKVTFYDLGGQKKIRSNWEHYYHDVHGIIYVVDGADKEKHEESAALFKEVCSHPRMAGKPMLVFSNKQDEAGAMAPADLETALSLSGSSCKVEGCVAKCDEGAEADSRLETSLAWMFEQLGMRYDELNERTKTDFADFEEEASRKKKEQKVRVLRQVLEKAFPADGGAPQECMTQEEGMAFVADEVGIALADLPAKAAEVAAACRYQRMALQMVGDFFAPISKKNKKLSWEECLELVEAQKATLPGCSA
jgi:small GTP-binding protein